MNHPRFRRTLTRALLLALAGIGLAGCIVEPYPGYYHPRRYYYYR